MKRLSLEEETAGSNSWLQSKPWITTRSEEHNENKHAD